jgi:hypothetical protein
VGVVQGLEEELEEVRMKKEAVDAQVRLPHTLPPLPLIRLIHAHGQDAERWSWRRNAGLQRMPISCSITSLILMDLMSSVVQLSGLRETEIRERQDWEGQHRKAQELHRREMEDLRKTVTEDAERRVAKGTCNDSADATEGRFYGLILST